ncbi:MAG: PLP-dependent aminotransferase family protein [Clostridiales bacterium]|nr:PLP-dependent aminotransferase family protein [Clostridiales bacterium]
MNYNFSNRMKDMQGSAIREIFKAAADPETISLAGGNPAPETFPAGELAKIASEILEKEGTLALQYGLTEGYPKLRTALCERLREKEGIGSENDELIVVSGGQQGIDLTVKCLLNEGDGILVEEPSFIGALNAFRSYGAKLIGVPMDEDGMSLSALREAIETNERIKAIYTIPNHQNPSGITMSAEKRQAVYQIAKEHGLVIIEDNPYGEITFDGKPPKSIKSLDDGTTVVYCGSFSKVLSPGMRIGFCIGPKEIIAKNVIAKQVADVHTPMLTQLLAYEYMTRYDMEANIQKAAALYRHKCETMLACIKKYFPSEITHTTPNGGLFIWCDMGEGYDAAEVALRCAKEKVVFVPGNTFMVDMNKPCSAFRLNYSTMSDEKIEEGIRILGGVLGDIMK